MKFRLLYAFILASWCLLAVSGCALEGGTQDQAEPSMPPKEEAISAATDLFDAPEAEKRAGTTLEQLGKNPPPEEPEEREAPQSFHANALMSPEMVAFEALHAVSPERERYLAFGAFILTSNRQSSRVFALKDFSAGQAAELIENSWGIVDRDTALVQLRSLAAAQGQSPIADEIFDTVIRNGITAPMGDEGLFLLDGNIGSLPNLYAWAKRTVEREDYFEEFLLLLEELGITLEQDEALELLVLITMLERVNSGLEAFRIGHHMLGAAFNFTMEEILAIETLAAWDFGRAAFIARYSVAAGYLFEEETWEYLKTAADSASALYSGWREYTLAYFLGRALAFGNDSVDQIAQLNFLLNHYGSPFATVDF